MKSRRHKLQGFALGSLLAIFPLPVLAQRTPANFAGAAQVAAKVAPAVFAISARIDSPAPLILTAHGASAVQDVASQGGSRLGSGFIIDRRGYALTSEHVVAGASQLLVTLADSRLCQATVVSVDSIDDIAMLKLNCRGPLPAVTLGDSAKVDTGEQVMALGNPYGLAGTVSVGIVSARQRYVAGRVNPFIQVQANLNPGNSGGPLLNRRGQVIGVNSAIFTQHGTNSGIGFALPIDIVREELSAMRGAGRLEHGRIGAEVHPIAADLAAAMGLERVGGALVTGVTKDSPAARAGLEQGDVLTSLNGQPIETAQELAPMLDRAAGSGTCHVTLIRRGRTLNVTMGIQRGLQGARWQAETRDFLDLIPISDYT